jgi:hypothetical protein
VKPDAIFLNLPERSRQGKVYPKYTPANELVVVNRCIDMGPITKLFPLLSISEPDDVIILVDDDNIYNEYTIETLLKGLESYPAVGFAGRIPQKGGLRFISNVPRATKATFLETFSAVAYKRWVLKDEAAVIDILFRCYDSVYCDDIVVGAILKTPPYIIPNGKCQVHYNHATCDTPRLSAINLSGRNEEVYECVSSLLVKQA